MKSVIASKYFPVKIKIVYDGQQAIYEFQNGYGASVVNHKYTYGGLELAVLHKGKICYNTSVTSDIGEIENKEDLDKILSRIEALPLTNQ